jgi:hypothetical protein
VPLQGRHRGVPFSADSFTSSGGGGPPAPKVVGGFFRALLGRACLVASRRRPASACACRRPLLPGVRVVVLLLLGTVLPGACSCAGPSR